RAFLAQRVPDTELVKDICVMVRDIADDQVCFDDERKHVFADIAGVDDFPRRASNEAGTLQRGSDELGMHVIEVDRASGGIFLDTERTNDKCALLAGWPHIHLGLPWNLAQAPVCRIVRPSMKAKRRRRSGTFYFTFNTIIEWMKV